VLIESSYKAEKERKRKRKKRKKRNDDDDKCGQQRSFYKSMTYEMMDIKEEKITKCFFSFH
jgi:hypothetical protein